MTRIFKVVFCVLTLCGAVTLAGCGENDAKPADDAADTAAAVEDAGTEEAAGEGSETK